MYEMRRHVGMADEADSKSVVCEHVWVQVPLPALKKGVSKHEHIIMYETPLFFRFL